MKTDSKTASEGVSREFSLEALYTQIEHLTALLVGGAGTLDEGLKLLTDSGEDALLHTKALRGKSPAQQILTAGIVYQATILRASRLIVETKSSDILYEVPK